MISLRESRPFASPRRRPSRLLWVSLAATAAALVMASSASAAPSPWWHLSSSSRPTNLSPGRAQDAVQKLTIDATAGEFGLIREFSGEPVGISYLKFDPTAQQVEEAVEALYGSGSAAVSGSGDEFLITFTGPRADQPVLPLVARNEGETEPLSGGAASATITVLAAGSADGEIVLGIENLGDATAHGEAAAIRIEDLPSSDLRAVAIAASRPKEGGIDRRVAIPCDLAALTCELAEPLLPFEEIEVRIPVVVEAGAGSASNEVRVSGGGARAQTLARALPVSPEPTRFGIGDYELNSEEEGGAASVQAGSHPFQSTTSLTVNQHLDTAPVDEKPAVEVAALPKDLDFNWPPGLIGNPTTVPTCPAFAFLRSQNGAAEDGCDGSSAVGVATVSVFEPATFGTLTFTVPLFNLEAEAGEPARFGFFIPLAGVPVVIDTALRSGPESLLSGPGENYAIKVEVHQISQKANLLSSSVTVWGDPGDARHDESRGWGCLYQTRNVTFPHPACLPSTTNATQAFLNLPTTCSGPQQSSLEALAWDGENGVFAPGEPLAALTGCNRIPFAPTITAATTETKAAAPTGLDFDITVNDEGFSKPESLVQSQIKRVTVALPQGVTTNPAVANGLSACTLTQYRAEALAGQSCPESSKIGEVEIESPVVRQKIDGSVYVAKQHDNPADNLLSIYMVAKNPELGVLVKSAGAVTPNRQTGQLTTTFDELPQLPFSHFHFAFRNGQRAPLITPTLCGAYQTQADLYPYSNPNSALRREATFSVTAGANGAPCATSEGQLPNKPSLEAGTLTPIAGAYSPFVFKVKRSDGSQTLSTVSATLPEGLLGKLAGIPYCPEAAIAQAESRSGEGQGSLELASPSCPAQSQVGTVTVGTGVGSQPYYVAGKAYLAGPYKGAPLSLAIITPAVVGPFDLGTIVVRTALHVNEQTAQITALSDPIPTIVHGLPTVVQSIALSMDRPNFTLNPTSCDPKQIEGSATSTLGAVAPLQQRFQVGACGALGFKPSLKLSLKGSTKRSGVPALKAVLSNPKGNNANIKSISTVLPKSEFIDNAHIGNTCTRVQFNAGAGHGSECPTRSILGHAKAYSPLLEKPLEGTVYFRSNGGERELPDLVAALRGQINVTLVGFIDSVRKNKHSEVSRLRTRFINVPDAPVSRFVLQLAGAKKGLLENSANLCKVKNIAQVKATAQNGKTYDTEPAVANDCGKKSKKKGGAKK